MWSMGLHMLCVLERTVDGAGRGNKQNQQQFMNMYIGAATPTTAQQQPRPNPCTLPRTNANLYLPPKTSHTGGEEGGREGEGKGGGQGK